MGVLKTRHRSRILFEESIRSEYTKRNYASHLRGLLRFAGMDDPNQLASMPDPELQHTLEDYLIRLKRTANPNSIPSMFRGIKHFCVMNEISINWDIISRMFPHRQKAQSLRAYTTEEVRGMIRGTTSPRDRALVHFFASTGARAGVFDHYLSASHMVRMPHGCTAVLLYAGDVEEYWGFLTPQATDALDAYHDSRRGRGETFCRSTPIFAAHGPRPRQLGWSGARSVIYRTMQRGRVSRLKCGSRFDVQACHGFRKRYNTILKLDNAVNHNIAEKLMGHKNGLDGVYFTPTLEDLFGEFRKVIAKLEV